MEAFISRASLSDGKRIGMRVAVRAPCPDTAARCLEKGRVSTVAVYEPVSLLAALGKARSGSLSAANNGPIASR